MTIIAVPRDGIRTCQPTLNVLIYSVLSFYFSKPHYTTRSSRLRCCFIFSKITIFQKIRTFSENKILFLLLCKMAPWIPYDSHLILRTIFTNFVSVWTVQTLFLIRYCLYYQQRQVREKQYAYWMLSIWWDQIPSSQLCAYGINTIEKSVPKRA